METQVNLIAPPPKSGSLQRAIYNVVLDSGSAMHRADLWKALPQQFHRPHGANKFAKALSNMVQRGMLVNKGTGRTGIYEIASRERWKVRQKHIRKIQRKCERKRKAKKKAANGHDTTPWKDPIIQRIDKRIGVLEHKLADLKALRELVREADL